MREIFGVQISVGAIINCEAKMTDALEGAYYEAKDYVEEAEVGYNDATGWYLFGELTTLWVMSTAQATIFRICKGGRDALKSVLGIFSGILVSDRHGVYSYWSPKLRQLCWSHLLRTFEKMASREGPSRKVGVALRRVGKQVFHEWHRFKRCEISRSTLRTYLLPLQKKLKQNLQRGTKCGHAQTERTCKRLLKNRFAIWTFVRVDGVDPTNNQSERALRSGVLWRKMAFGSWSKRGCLYVERMLTVSETCRQQNLSAFSFLCQAISANLCNSPVPSLLPSPEITTSAIAA
jgi:transposase